LQLQEGNAVASEVAPSQAVTIVTQASVMAGKEGEYTAWQDRVNSAVAGFPGFLNQAVIAPMPPAQLHWVIVQRFRSMEDAQRWMGSSEREKLLAEIAPILTGADEIHFFTGSEGTPTDRSVSAVISTRVAPGHEEQYRAWQRKIAAEEATFPGYLGSHIEPPIAGVQEDWSAVVHFDTDEHLQAWIDSEQRRRLLQEAVAIGAGESQVRKVQGGFENWFTFGKPPGAAVPPAWKQNMVVLLILYPVVFLFGAWVGTPLLARHGFPFFLVLFLGNIFSVVTMGYWLVPWANRTLSWWLSPKKDAPSWINAAGTALVIALYGLALAIFSRFP
jgi:antibiotic biosynthesis monooxygenase (ABM) superfamily enzyme